MKPLPSKTIYCDQRQHAIAGKETAYLGICWDVMSAQRESSMRTETQSLVEKIEALPPEQVRQVEDFVDCIASNPRRAAALDRLLSIAPALEAAGVPPMSDDEIQAEIAAVRSTLRARNIRADRS